MNMIVDDILEVALVEPAQLGMVWGQVETILDKGEEFFRGYYKTEHIYNAISCGQMQLWIGYKNAKVKIIMLTQFDFYPEGNQLRFVYMGGETGSLKQVMYMFGKVELWGIQHGARKACIIGRDGWLKKLARYGYQKKSILLVKELVQNFGQTWSM